MVDWIGEPKVMGTVAVKTPKGSPVVWPPRAGENVVAWRLMSTPPPRELWSVQPASELPLEALIEPVTLQAVGERAGGAVWDGRGGDGQDIVGVAGARAIHGALGRAGDAHDAIVHIRGRALPEELPPPVAEPERSMTPGWVTK